MFHNPADRQCWCYCNIFPSANRNTWNTNPRDSTQSPGTTTCGVWLGWGEIMEAKSCRSNSSEEEITVIIREEPPKKTVTVGDKISQEQHLGIGNWSRQWCQACKECRGNEEYDCRCKTGDAENRWVSHCFRLELSFISDVKCASWVKLGYLFT